VDEANVLDVLVAAWLGAVYGGGALASKR
jgi:hypothetical protein